MAWFTNSQRDTLPITFTLRGDCFILVTGADTEREAGTICSGVAFKTDIFRYKNIARALRFALTVTGGSRRLGLVFRDVTGADEAALTV